MRAKSPNRKQVKKLLKKISHKGAGKEACWPDGYCLGMISNYSTQKNPQVLMDGRIYNIDKLVQKHDTDNSSSLSDSEKISQLINKMGSSVIKEFQGAFSLVATDEDNNTYLARDTIGIKPLYYVQDDQSVTFASEIKSLLEYGDRINRISSWLFDEK
ncbi:MAG: hypothetical protein U5N58_01230 [Actinomycetota bacterium]|nr:hypothetical protein [Actinomycetota bacterium]